jgi:hypothetical protein
MELLRDFSDIIGTEDFSAEICQAYLDQPLGFNNDTDVLVPNLDFELLNDIIIKIKDCDQDQLSGKSDTFVSFFIAILVWLFFL